MNCPVCKKRNATAGHILGHGKSAAKTASSRANAKLGGRPRKNTLKQHKPIANKGF